MNDLELAQQEIRRLRKVVREYQEAIDQSINHLEEAKQDVTEVINKLENSRR
jgi:prefoldin subunit 5